MSTIVTRSGKGSALTFTEMDNNFSNLNTDKLENIVTDTTPQLGGNLDVNGNSIVSASAGNIAITPDTTGSIVLDGLNWPQADGSAGQFLKTNGAGQLSFDAVSVAAINDIGDVTISGTPADNEVLAYDTGSGDFINQTAAEAGLATSAQGSLADSALQDVVDDTTPQLGGSLDVNGNSIVSVSNGAITIAPNGTGSVILNAPTGGIDIKSSPITTTTTNGNISLAPNGTGVVFINNGLQLVNDYASSGFGIVSGTTSTGILLRANAAAGGANDPQIGLTSGGGLSITPGATSTTTFNGTNVSNMQLKDYKETVYTGGSTTGTITPDVANGNVQSITLTGSITLNAFANAEAGQSMTLIVKQPSSGGPYTLTSTMVFAGGTKTLSTGANEIDIISIFYDGTTYYASLATNFS